MLELTYACEEPDGQHVFPEAEITEDDPEPGVLRAGEKVVRPCETCGMTPLEQMDQLGRRLEEAEAAAVKLLADKDTPLFHWSPRSRRKQIVRYGLRPRMRATTNLTEDFRLATVCLATSPEWAWRLSGGQRGAPTGAWDLWETRASVLKDVEILGSYDRHNGIHEVRTTQRIYKRDLLLAGTWAKE